MGVIPEPCCNFALCFLVLRTQYFLSDRLTSDCTSFEFVEDALTCLYTVSEAAWVRGLILTGRTWEFWANYPIYTVSRSCLWRKKAQDRWNNGMVLSPFLSNPSNILSGDQVTPAVLLQWPKGFRIHILVKSPNEACQIDHPESETSQSHFHHFYGDFVLTFLVNIYRTLTVVVTITG